MNKFSDVDSQLRYTCCLCALFPIINDQGIRYRQYCMYMYLYIQWLEEVSCMSWQSDNHDVVFLGRLYQGQCYMTVVVVQDQDHWPLTPAVGDEDLEQPRLEQFAVHIAALAVREQPGVR